MLQMGITLVHMGANLL